MARSSRRNRLPLLALYSCPWASSATEQGLTALMLRQQPAGLWPAVGDGAGANLWDTAMAINTLLIFGLIQRHSVLRLTPWFTAGH